MKETTVPAYRWAKEIKKLDGNKCAFCGSTDRLEAHHILQKASHEEDATDLENGITLCHKCHYTAHGSNYTTNQLKYSRFKEFSTSFDTMNAFIEDYKNRKVVFAISKADLEKIKAHAEQNGESINAFIKRAIMEVTEMDDMHKAYQRGLLRHLERMNDAMENGNLTEAKKLLAELIEDTKKDIEE